ncbi:uncharacterized protein LOC128708582 [Anopheles marshallii]|uniref:uncharacterized protein LOC128708582 n=1 Tax=Anopheles marshallii TaxID=1521116 RepID=UPI00237A3CDF|nr:uncharacterized protein LOC128708582 [Anopheles marshallii]
MAMSQLVEKLKFGEKYVLANIVVLPLAKPPNSDECKVPARNKFLTIDIWESFVYRKLYDLFRKHIVEHDKDPLYQINTEYHLIFHERPYLQMKYVFRDNHYRTSLNILFKEKLTNLHDACIYVEISDHGRAMFDKVENLGKTIQRLSREIEMYKRESANVVTEAAKPKYPSNHCVAPEVEEYRPEPVKKSTRNTFEEYVPVTRNGASPGIKRTYKPSKIGGDGGKPAGYGEPDPYTPGTVDLPSKISYTSTSSPQNKMDSRKHLVASTVRVEKNLFGSDDDDEYDPTCSESPADPQTKNDSGKDMFADSEQHSPRDDGDRKPKSSEPGYHAKREVLPRSSKQNKRGLLAESPEEKAQRKASKKPGSVKTEEESLNKVMQLKKVIRRKKDGSLKKQSKIEKICEVATEIKRLSKVEVLDCIDLSKEEILDTFSQYKQELHGLYVRNKDYTERQWKSSNELCYFTDFGNILDDEQKFAMMQHLEDEFVPEHQQGKYTEFFTSALVMEWGLRIFMERHNFVSREIALERIKQQEKSYIASLSDDFMSKYH